MDGFGHWIPEMMDVFLRAGGIMPVWLPYNSTDEDLYDILGQVNGVFLTGGSVNLFDPVTKALHPYTVTSQKILNYAMERHDNGDYFPLFGVC